MATKKKAAKPRQTRTSDREKAATAAREAVQKRVAHLPRTGGVYKRAGDDVVAVDETAKAAEKAAGESSPTKSRK